MLALLKQFPILNMVAVNIVDPGSNGTDLWSSYEWSKSSQFNYFMVN